MKWNIEWGNIPTQYMVTYSTTKGPLQLGRGRMDLSVESTMGYQYGKIIHLRCVDLNVKDKAVKILEENTGESHDLGTGSHFSFFFFFSLSFLKEDRKLTNHKNERSID